MHLIALSSAGRPEKDGDWEQRVHFMFEAALAVGWAYGIARLIEPSTAMEELSPDGAAPVPVGLLSPIGRWLMPVDAGYAILGLVYVYMLAGGSPLRDFRLLWFSLALMLCLFYGLGQLAFLVGAARWRLQPSSPQSKQLLMSVGVVSGGLGLMASPIVGYLLGTALTLLPGTSGWSLAPCYGMVFGVAGEIVFDAMRQSVRAAALSELGSWKRASNSMSRSRP